MSEDNTEEARYDAKAGASLQNELMAFGLFVLNRRIGLEPELGAENDLELFKDLLDDGEAAEEWRNAQAHTRRYWRKAAAAVMESSLIMAPAKQQRAALSKLITRPAQIMYSLDE